MIRALLGETCWPLSVDSCCLLSIIGVKFGLEVWLRAWLAVLHPLSFFYFHYLFCFVHIQTRVKTSSTFNLRHPTFPRHRRATDRIPQLVTPRIYAHPFLNSPRNPGTQETSHSFRIKQNKTFNAGQENDGPDVGGPVWVWPMTKVQRHHAAIQKAYGTLSIGGMRKKKPSPERFPSSHR